jgi:exonuclease SbcC
VIDENKKKADVLFLKPKRKKKNTNKSWQIQAELTTLKSKRLDGTILMDLGNWYTIRESLKHNGKELKVR